MLKISNLVETQDPNLALDFVNESIGKSTGEYLDFDEKANATKIRGLLYSLVNKGHYDEVLKFIYNFKSRESLDNSLNKLFSYLKQKIRTLHFQPSLSIVVPVYNSGLYLEKCLTSILNQTYEDFELLIVDDASTDDSADIIARFESSDARIKVIKNIAPSGNPGTPRNQALEEAKGLYIGFVDSDDWVDEDYYHQLMDLALSDNADIVFSGGFRNHESNGKVSERKYNSFGFNKFGSLNFKNHESFMIWDKVFHSRLLKSNSIWLGETKAAVDVPFIFKAYYYAVDVAFCEKFIGYNYRRESMSSVTLSHRKNSNCEFEFIAYDNVYKWANKSSVMGYFLKNIDIKMVASLTYTLKVISDTFFFDVVGRVRKLFSSVDDKMFKSYCKQSKKWWLYKEFRAVLDNEDAAVKDFFEYKRLAKEKKELQRKLVPSFSLDGTRKGILFFPCWVKSNPYQRLFYEALNKNVELSVEGFQPESLCKELILKKADSFKYIHLHWLHNFFSLEDNEKLESVCNVLDYAKNLGYKILYTAHNIVSHESTNFDRELAARYQILQRVDDIIVHGSRGKAMLESTFPLSSSAVHTMPHGSYGDYYGVPIPRATARDRFSISEDKIVFLFFGNIRAYKGLVYLIEHFKFLYQERPDVHLLIAGRVLDSDSESYLSKECTHEAISYYPGFIEDAEVINYFSCADLCVLPYQKILTSGAAFLSCSLSCPVLAPSDGVLPEFIDSNIGILFNDYSDMYRKMVEYCNNKDTFDTSFDFSHFNDLYHWDNVTINLNFLR